MHKWSGKVAMVTGASSGIGAATARALARHGITVVALARRQDKLEDLVDELKNEGARGKVHPKKADMRKEDDITSAFEWVESELGGADIVVNNAGVLHTGFLSEGKMEEWRDMFDVNVLAAALCSKLFLNSLRRRNIHTGHIVMVNSVAGHTAEFAEAAMYCGTKHALKAITMCLRRELAERNSTVKVTSICPGPVATEIFRGTYLDKIEERIPMLQAEDVATAIVDALAASDISEICEIVLNPVPTKHAIY